MNTITKEDFLKLIRKADRIECFDNLGRFSIQARPPKVVFKYEDVNDRIVIQTNKDGSYVVSIPGSFSEATVRLYKIMKPRAKKS